MTLNNLDNLQQANLSQLHQMAAEMMIKKPLEAARLYQAVLDRDPGDEDAKSAYAKCMALAHNYPLAISLYQDLLRSKPDDARYHTNLANVFRARDEHEKAAKHYRNALLQQPDLFQALKGLAISLAALQRYTESEVICIQALEIATDDQICCAYGLCKLASGDLDGAIVLHEQVTNKKAPDARLLEYKILKAKGKSEEAGRLIKTTIDDLKSSPGAQAAYIQELLLSGDREQMTHFLALYDEQEPTDPRLLLTLATVARLEGSLAKAMQYAAAVIQQDPSNLNAICIKADVLKQSDNYHAAIALLEEAHTSCQPSVHSYSLLSELLLLTNKEEPVRGLLADMRKLCVSSQDYVMLAGLYQSLGQMEDCQAVLQSAFQRDRTYPGIWNQIASLNDKALARTVVEWIEANRSLLLLANPDLPQSYALANLYHVNGEHAKASVYYAQANKIKESIAPSNFTRLQAEAIRAKQMLLSANLPKCHEGGEDQIFIVGMPRSGSTLLETILTVNPQVDDLGESPILSHAVHFLSTPKAKEQQITLAQVYKRMLEEYSHSEKPIKTNKQLNNYLYSPLIATQLPNARIIHATRHPLDNVLSIYRANFGDPALSYTSNLEDIARLLLLSDDIMAVYKQHHPGSIYTYNYDALTQNPDVEIRALIYWLGWEWNPGYLAPHEAKRIVLTASKAQVRSPISSKSVGGWKRYWQLLEPAYRVLADAPQYKFLHSEYRDLLQ